MIVDVGNELIASLDVFVKQTYEHGIFVIRNMRREVQMNNFGTHCFFFFKFYHPNLITCLGFWIELNKTVD
mgnify:CR=1 FL=1